MGTKQRFLYISWEVRSCLVFVGLSNALFDTKVIKACINFFLKHAYNFQCIFIGDFFAKAVGFHSAGHIYLVLESFK